MNSARINVGDAVTWGSGSPRAAVVGFTSKQDDMDNVVDYASVELSADLKSPCGRVWPTGKRIDIPTQELRRLS